MARTELEREFIEDHQKLTSGFRKVIDAVELNDPQKMQAAAESLDKVAGPHVHFEETVLYPKVGRDRSDGIEKKLLQEHQVARSAILFLADHGEARWNPKTEPSFWNSCASVWITPSPAELCSVTLRCAARISKRRCWKNCVTCAAKEFAGRNWKRFRDSPDAWDSERRSHREGFQWPAR